LLFANFKYDNCINIGDNIQAVAAARFLPQVDYLIERDYLGDWRNDDHSETVKMIANAWYMGAPYAWPPQEPDLLPLLIAMHVNNNQKVREVFRTPESVQYLKDHQPIGARDKESLEFFESIGVESYFSGCVTLTLNPDPAIAKGNFVLLVSVSDEVYEAVAKQTSRPIIRIDVLVYPENEKENKFALAEKFLYLYQAAHCVITTRLHAALPSLALGTPVLFITDSKGAKFDPDRLAGLKELAINGSEQEFLDGGIDFDAENPPSNPETYLAIREDIISRCSEFTGFDSNSSFAKFHDFANFSITDCYDLIRVNIEHHATLPFKWNRAELDQEITAVRDINQKLYDKIDSIERDLRGFRVQSESLRSTNQKLYDKIDGLESDLRQANHQNQSRQQRIDELKQSFADTKAELHQEVQETNTELEWLAQELQSLKSKNEEYARVISDILNSRAYKLSKTLGTPARVVRRTTASGSSTEQPS